MRCDQQKVEFQPTKYFNYQVCTGTGEKDKGLFMSGFPVLHSRSKNEMHEFGKTFNTYMYVEGSKNPSVESACCGDWTIEMKKLLKGEVKREKEKKEKKKNCVDTATRNIKDHAKIICVSRSNQVLLQVLNKENKMTGKNFVMVAPEIYALDMPTLTSVFEKHSECRFEVHYSLYDKYSAAFHQFDTFAKIAEFQNKYPNVHFYRYEIEDAPIPEDKPEHVVKTEDVMSHLPVQQCFKEFYTQKKLKFKREFAVPTLEFRTFKFAISIKKFTKSANLKTTTDKNKLENIWRAESLMLSIKAINVQI